MAGVGVALVLLAAPVLALIGDADAVTSNTFTAATLQPPTSLTATASCQFLSPRITLNWTATTSTGAVGYKVFRGTVNGGPYSEIATVAGRTTTSYLDTGVNLNTRYYYVLQSYVQNWRSADSNQATAQTALLCL